MDWYSAPHLHLTYTSSTLLLHLTCTSFTPHLHLFYTSITLIYYTTLLLLLLFPHQHNHTQSCHQPHSGRHSKVQFIKPPPPPPPSLPPLPPLPLLRGYLSIVTLWPPYGHLMATLWPPYRAGSPSILELLVRDLLESHNDMLAVGVSS